MRSRTSPPRDLLASIRAPRRRPRMRAAAAPAGRWLPGGPTCTRRSRSTRRRRSRCPGCEHEEPIAGQGAPLVAEFCLAELGTVLGISSTAAKKLVGHALELRHRLPRLWAQVQAGRVPAWRARAVAEATIHTTPALTGRGRGVRRRPGRRRRRSGRCGAAGPARRGDDQAVRPRRRRPGRGPGGRLPPRRPAPRHAPRRRRALRRHDAARGRARHRRRPRPRPGPRPRRRVAEGPRVRRVARRPPLRRPRRPRPHPDRARPRRGGSRPPAPAGRSRGRPPRPLRRHPSTA